MYLPFEDSFFFAEFLSSYLKKLPKKEKKKLKFLDMGTGSGILAETAKHAGIREITAVDIDKEAVDYVEKIKRIKAIHSDLFSNVNGKFDIITFNAPYLPKDKFGIDKGKDTTGGKKGDETAIKFIKQAKQHLEKGGKIFLLVSSLTPKTRIKKFLQKGILGYRNSGKFKKNFCIRKFSPKIAAKKRIFFEELVILEIS